MSRHDFWAGGRRVAFGISLLLAVPSAGAGAYYQMPTTDGDRVVFMSQGDLWIASIDGAVATRLTSHVEIESNPRLSPDGQHVAFIAAYDDQPDVYVISTEGGVPTRLTWNEGVSAVHRWLDDLTVVYTSNAVRGPGSSSRIRSIQIDDSDRREWPLAEANQLAVGDDRTAVFTRWGMHRTGDHLRGYAGGARAALWRYRDGDPEATPLQGDHRANASDPMIRGDRLYFLSDHTGTAEIWSSNLDGDDLRQHTNHAGWDVRTPDLGGTSIVYKVGADIHRLDLESDQTTLLRFIVQSDLDARRPRWIPEPRRFLQRVTLAPRGDRVAFTIRGRVLTVGLPKSRRIEISLDGAERARLAAIGPEGRWLYAVVAGDELFEEIYRFPLDGASTREQVTSGSQTRIAQFSVAPAGGRLVYSDMTGDLFSVNLDDRVATQIDDAPHGDDIYFDFAWTQDGRLLAYAKNIASRPSVIALRDFETNESRQVSTSRFPSHAPTFSRDGLWLYFVSDRHFEATPSSPWGDRNLGPMFDS